MQYKTLGELCKCRVLIVLIMLIKLIVLVGEALVHNARNV
jgi:hypothetical protein